MSQSSFSRQPSAQPACHYCHLPINQAIDGAVEEPVYCCFGCRFAESVTGATGDQGEARWTASALGISVFCSMNVMMMTMALWSYAPSTPTAFEAGLADFLRYGAMLSTSVVVLLLGRPLVQSAFDQLRLGFLSTDLLLLTGVIAAFGISVISTLRSQGHVYFEVSCVILVLVTLGRWLEATGRLQASAALDELEQLIPDEIRVVWDNDDQTMQSRDAVKVGQRVRVLAGERIPVDGSIVRGRGVVDEQFFTGESVPVEKGRGDSVLGGSLNLDGDLVVEVMALVAEGALGRLVDAVRNARLLKGHFQNLADRWSRRFFPIIAVVALATLVCHGLRSGWETAVLTSLSVTLIACPCALALATPLAIWSALSTAASRGVLFRSGEAIERLATIQAVRWDKTGTLTTGSPLVRALLVEDVNDRPEIERFAFMMASSSNHVYSTAIRQFLSDADATPLTAAVETVPGRGLKIQDPGLGEICLGSESFAAESGLEFGPAIGSRLAATDRASLSKVFIGWSGLIRGAFLLEEVLRPESIEAINRCLMLGLDVAVLTGDRDDRARWLNEQLGHDNSIHVLAELSPLQKLAEIKKAHDQFGNVAMVGDGLNDAPSLAAADIGVAMGCGADVSRDSADVCLLPNDLRLFPWAVRLSRRTVRTIRKNLFWSFSYNGIGVLIAAFGWLHPAVAAILMIVSSLVVLSNSLKLRNAGDEKETDADRRSNGMTPASSPKTMEATS